MSTSPDAPVLACRAVSKIYATPWSLRGRRKSIAALDDVSMSIPRGRCVALVGESGSGKTTLAQLLLGLERPTAGEVLLHGQPILTIKAQERARMLQPVFQDPGSALNPRLSLRQILERPLLYQGERNRATRLARATEILEQVGLPVEMLGRRPGDLSGGQQQRIAIARALVLNPGVLVLDEPTSALDPSIQAQILALLRTLQRALNLTYLFITHDLAIVNAFADDVAVMYRGRIVESGTSTQVLYSPQHAYTKLLIAAARR